VTVTYDNDNLDKVATFVISPRKYNEAPNGDAGYFIHYQEGAYSLQPPITGSAVYSWVTPAAVAWNGDQTRLDVFTVRWPNNVIVHGMRDLSKSADRSTLQDIGGYSGTSPTAVTRAFGAIDLFVQAGDHRLWHLTYSDAVDVKWGNWTAVGGATRIQGHPSAVSVAADTLDMFVWGEDNSMLRATYNSMAQTWSPEAGFTTVVDKKLLGPPSAMTDGSGDINVFAYSQASELIWTRLRPGEATGDAEVLANVDFPDMS
jgi:hypothetical protein